jgi:hypothetical protein
MPPFTSDIAGNAIHMQNFMHPRKTKRTEGSCLSPRKSNLFAMRRIRCGRNAFCLMKLQSPFNVSAMREWEELKAKTSIQSQERAGAEKAIERNVLACLLAPEVL